MKKALSDFQPGDVVFTSERLGDEIREVFYLREGGRACLYDYDVPVARLGIVQGDPENPSEPRYKRVANPPCRDPGEADGRVPAALVENGSIFFSSNNLGASLKSEAMSGQPRG